MLKEKVSRKQSVAEVSSTSPLTRDVEDTFRSRMQREPEFSVALLSEAISLLANGEPDVCRLTLRDIVNGTLGFESMATKLEKPSKSLHRMLSAKGNPTMDNLAAIINVLRQHLGIRSIEVEAASNECLEGSVAQESGAGAA